MEINYRYDGNGNRLEKQQKYGTTTYSYDNMNRPGLFHEEIQK